MHAQRHATSSASATPGTQQQAFSSPSTVEKRTHLEASDNTNTHAFSQQRSSTAVRDGGGGDAGGYNSTTSVVGDVVAVNVASDSASSVFFTSQRSPPHSNSVVHAAGSGGAIRTGKGYAAQMGSKAIHLAKSAYSSLQQATSSNTQNTADNTSKSVRNSAGSIHGSGAGSTAVSFVATGDTTDHDSGPASTSTSLDPRTSSPPRIASSVSMSALSNVSAASVSPDEQHHDPLKLGSGHPTPTTTALPWPPKRYDTPDRPAMRVGSLKTSSLGRSNKIGSALQMPPASFDPQGRIGPGFGRHSVALPIHTLSTAVSLGERSSSSAGPLEQVVITTRGRSAGSGMSSAPLELSLSVSPPDVSPFDELQEASQHELSSAVDSASHSHIYTHPRVRPGSQPYPALHRHVSLHVASPSQQRGRQYQHQQNSTNLEGSAALLGSSPQQSAAISAAVNAAEAVAAMEEQERIHLSSLDEINTPAEFSSPRNNWTLNNEVGVKQMLAQFGGGSLSRSRTNGMSDTNGTQTNGRQFSLPMVTGPLPYGSGSGSARSLPYSKRVPSLYLKYQMHLQQQQQQQQQQHQYLHDLIKNTSDRAAIEGKASSSTQSSSESNATSTDVGASISQPIHQPQQQSQQQTQPQSLVQLPQSGYNSARSSAHSSPQQERQPHQSNHTKVVAFEPIAIVDTQDGHGSKMNISLGSILSSSSSPVLQSSPGVSTPGNAEDKASLGYEDDGGYDSPTRSLNRRGTGTSYAMSGTSDSFFDNTAEDSESNDGISFKDNSSSQKGTRTRKRSSSSFSSVGPQSSMHSMNNPTAVGGQGSQAPKSIEELAIDGEMDYDLFVETIRLKRNKERTRSISSSGALMSDESRVASPALITRDDSGGSMDTAKAAGLRSNSPSPRATRIVVADGNDSTVTKPLSGGEADGDVERIFSKFSVRDKSVRFADE